MIRQELLLQYGAEIKTYQKNETIFLESHYPTHYYQIVEGKVKMNNYNEDGKEFIQNIFIKDQSFGEPPLFIDECYPANAETITKASIIQISKEDFYKMMHENPEVSLALNKSLARRLYYKSIMAPEISSQEPEKRLLTLLDYLKTHRTNKDEKEFVVDFTRQQIADLTGLRVETVIRTFKHLERQGKVKIINAKIVVNTKS